MTDYDFIDPDLPEKREANKTLEEMYPHRGFSVNHPIYETEGLLVLDDPIDADEMATELEWEMNDESPWEKFVNLVRGFL